jgi:hypothetical protein
METIFSLQHSFLQAKKSFILLPFLITCIAAQLHAQKVGVGTNSPVKLFSVNGSILLDQTNTSNGILDSAALLFGTQGGVGIAAKKTLGGLINGLQFYTNNISRVNISASGNVGIGTLSPLYPLHVVGDIYASSDIRAIGTGRFDGSLSIGGAGFAGMKFSVHSGDSYFQGNGSFTGNANIGGALTANSLSIASTATLQQNLNVGNNLTVSNDGIINGNFRVDGRIGINGYTNANYGLIVNNANTYLQGSATITGNAAINGNTTVSGNTTVAGSTNLQGAVTIQGKGSVRSDGTSSLRIGFSSYYTNMVYDGKAEKAITVDIANFEGAGNVRVAIAQFEPGDGYEGDVRDFDWWVYDVDPVTDTCKIRLVNESAFIRVLKGTFYLMAVAKD